MIAVIKTGGKQYKVKKGDVLKIEKIDHPEGNEVVFDQVLLAGDKVGTPLVDGVKVKAQVVAEGKGDKVRVVKYKAKTRYHKVRGHRQLFTQIKIMDIA